MKLAAFLSMSTAATKSSQRSLFQMHHATTTVPLARPPLESRASFLSPGMALDESLLLPSGACGGRGAFSCKESCFHPPFPHPILPCMHRWIVLFHAPLPPNPSYQGPTPSMPIPPKRSEAPDFGRRRFASMRIVSRHTRSRA